MLVSPAPRTSMVLGKILGAATLAWIQGLIFLAFAPLAGVRMAGGIGAGGRGDSSGLVYPDRAGLRDRLEMESISGFHA